MRICRTYIIEVCTRTEGYSAVRFHDYAVHTRNIQVQGVCGHAEGRHSRLLGHPQDEGQKVSMHGQELASATKEGFRDHEVASAGMLFRTSCQNSSARCS